jgi:20S proteasome alpha/beta subunit
MRPFGIKLIMIGYDSTGPLIFDFDNDGNFKGHKFSVQGKNSNKVLSTMEEFENENENENFSLDELVVKIILIYSESIKEVEKRGVDNHSVLLSLIGKNLELFVLNKKIMEFYLNIFQKRGEKVSENYFDLETIIKNVDSESTCDWSSYDSDPCLTEDCSACFS